MPIKSGFAHAIAGSCSILLSAYLSAHSDLIRMFTEITGQWIVVVTPVEIAPEIVGLITIVSILMFLWGVAYHRVRHGRKTTDSSQIQVKRL